MTKDAAVSMARSLGIVVREVVAAAVAEISSRISALEQREIPAGPQGERGERGLDGNNGAPGRDGVNGIDGKEGIPGRDGANGLNGKDGAAGIDGKDGAPGLNGKDGLDGQPGLIGPQGIPGEAGAKGEPGKDGRDGIDGKDGAPGVAGEKGEQGIQGQSGAIGERGEKGIDGKDGRDGREGKDGRDGEHGKDALQIDILPAIDETRSYPRGTFARFAGGLVRATQNTDPTREHLTLKECGWEVVVQGLAGITITQGEDPRQFSVECRMTSGEKSILTGRFPALEYQGVFTDGKSYVRGDVVTYGGSAWHCDAETTKTIPGVLASSKDWRLMVKQGRAGKDAAPIQPPKNGNPVRLS